MDTRKCSGEDSYKIGTLDAIEVVDVRDPIIVLNIIAGTTIQRDDPVQLPSTNYVIQDAVVGIESLSLSEWQWKNKTGSENLGRSYPAGPRSIFKSYGFWISHPESYPSHPVVSAFDHV